MKLMFLLLITTLLLSSCLNKVTGEREFPTLISGDNGLFKIEAGIDTPLGMWGGHIRLGREKAIEPKEED